MTSYKYNDGLCPGGRRPRLYLAKGSEVRKFDGQNIPDFFAVVTSQYRKNGKWSNTDYTLDLANGVRALEFLSPLHGTWGDDLSSWGEVAERLGLPVDVAQGIVRVEYPKTGERLDQLEAFAIAAEQQGSASETVVVSFGSPTNRAARNGYWSNPKEARTTDGRTVTIKPGGEDGSPDWYTAEAVAPSGAKILSSRHNPGMHGGYWTIEVAVPVLTGFPEKESHMKIDMSLKNPALYAGCEIEEVAGRANLKTPVAEAVNLVGRNIGGIIETVPAAERGEVTLTGPMAVWSYLVVFHAVVHRFSKVYYDDGRSGAVLVAAHG